jgi:hypothetical protein
MTEEECKSCGKVHGSAIVICQATGTRYQGRVRRKGCRLYEPIGRPSKSYKVAFRRMAKAFVDGGYKRGDVIMWADYYDPERVCELVRG